MSKPVKQFKEVEQQVYPPPFLIEQIMSASHLFGGQIESKYWAKIIISSQFRKKKKKMR